ncbi:unnamed protein product [Cochlearia groenlandica]
MLEESEKLTFPMERESELASRLRAIVSDMLPRFIVDNSDGDLSEYITVLVCNGKSLRQAREDLEAFLGEQSRDFVACLWELLLKDFSQGRQQESFASEPVSAVEFGNDDTLIEKGSSSRRRNDYDDKATNATYWLNENLMSVSDPIQEDDAKVSPKVKTMKMLRQELINSPCKREKPREKDDWNLSGVNYSRKVLRSIVVSAIKQPCDKNPDNYEKSMDKRSGILQNRPYLPEREMKQLYSPSASSGRAVSERSHDVISSQEMKPHISVWDRLGRPSSKFVLDEESPTLPKFRSQTDDNKVVQQYVPAFPTAYIEKQSETFQRTVPLVGYRNESITHTETHGTHNLGRKRRYGIIDLCFGDDSVGVLKYNNQAKQDVEKPTLLSYQSAKPDVFSEILTMKQKLQQLEIQINQAKQLKKRKAGEPKRSPQSGETQNQQDVAESRMIHVTNVHYAAKIGAISMLFSKCGAVKNVTILTDPVTLHPMGAAFVTFATKESVNKAIAMNNTMFYSRPIKVHSQNSFFVSNPLL